MPVEAQPKALLMDGFAAALLRGTAAWPTTAFPVAQVLDRTGTVVASEQLTGLRVENDGSAHADPVWLASYTPGDSLMQVEIRGQAFGRMLVIELVPPVDTPQEPFWLVWDARGIFRP